MTDPIGAVTEPDPYPYYADLVARAPLHRDERLRLWVASSASAVSTVLTSELCRVRPPSEPVPAALVGSAAGDVFARLVRMNDGPRHATLKPAVESALVGFDTDRIIDRARVLARALAAELEPVRAPARLRDFALRLPVYVVADMLGVPDADLARTARFTEDFAGGLAPGASAEAITRAGGAAGELREMFRARVGTHITRNDHQLDALLTAARQSGIDDDTVVANAIGLLFQSHEATAALIANTVARLGADAELCGRVAGDQRALTAVVREVVRWDAPVQNTRRFVARAGLVAGEPMKEGDAILVILAAANRDPAVNAEPDRFDAGRSSRVAFTFGIGPHACPGEAVATTIASAGVHELLQAGLDPIRLGGPSAYRKSVNIRMALWESAY
jgi:cytochrome P450